MKRTITLTLMCIVAIAVIMLAAIIWKSEVAWSEKR